MKAIFEIALSVTLMAAAAGNLPWVLKQVRSAKLQLILDSRTSNWGRAWTPPSR